MKARDSLESRYCAFIDILGFSNYVRTLSSARIRSSRGEIVERLRRINAQFEKEKRDFLDTLKSDGSLSYFSDSIFLSIRSSREGSFGDLFHYVQRICTALLIDGFLTRGAVVRGEIHHVDSVVFGPAIVDAYQLESMVAKYPRVIVARSALPRLEDAGDAVQKLLPSDDGPIRLNCLQFFELLVERVCSSGGADYLASPKYKERLQFLRTVRDQLQQQIHNTRDNPRHHENVRWLAVDFNKRVISKLQSGIADWPKPVSLDNVWPDECEP